MRPVRYICSLKNTQRISHDRHTLIHYTHTHTHTLTRIYTWNRLSYRTLSTVRDKAINYLSYQATIMSQTATSWSLSVTWYQFFFEKPTVYAGQGIHHISSNLARYYVNAGPPTNTILSQMNPIYINVLENPSYLYPYAKLFMYVCMYVCMYYICMYVCMYVSYWAILGSRVLFVFIYVL